MGVFRSRRSPGGLPFRCLRYIIRSVATWQMEGAGGGRTFFIHPFPPSLCKPSSILLIVTGLHPPTCFHISKSSTARSLYFGEALCIIKVTAQKGCSTRELVSPVEVINETRCCLAVLAFKLFQIVTFPQNSVSEPTHARGYVAIQPHYRTLTGMKLCAYCLTPKY